MLICRSLWSASRFLCFSYFQPLRRVYSEAEVITELLGAPKKFCVMESRLGSGIRVMLVNLQFSVLFGAMSPFPPPPAGAAHLCTPCVPAIGWSPWPGEIVCSAQTLREGIHRPLVDGASERRGTVSAWQRQVYQCTLGRLLAGLPGSHRTGPCGQCLCSELQVSEPS